MYAPFRLQPRIPPVPSSHPRPSGVAGRSLHARGVAASAAVLLGVVGLAAGVFAQAGGVEPVATQAAVPAIDFSGHHFGGIALPLSLQEANILLAGGRVSAWTEAAPVPGSAETGEVGGGVGRFKGC